MSCPHFAGIFMKYCVAEKEVYVQSIYETREHCTQLLHKVCRHYMRTNSGSGERSSASVACDDAHHLELWDVR